MSKAFYSCDSVTHEGKSNIWFTPKNIINGLGDFDLDPATVSYRPFNTAKNHYEHDKNQDGLLLPWHGRVFINPPYGKSTELWLDKLAVHGNGIALTFASLETYWGQKHAQLSDGIFLISGRVRFIRCDHFIGNNAGKGSCLFIYGKHNLKNINLDGILLKKYEEVE